MLEKILTRQRFPIWAEEYARSVTLAYNPDCIILFGSTARNEHTPDSDIDVLIIGGRLPDTYRERFRLLMHLRPPFAPLQVQAFSRPEWERMMVEKHVTVLEALQDGVPLHGQDLFARWRQTFETWLARGLRRTRCTWVIPPTLQQAATSQTAAS